MNLLTRLAVALALPSIFAASFSTPQPLPPGQATGTLVLPPRATHGVAVSGAAEHPQAFQGHLRVGGGPAAPRAEQQRAGS